MLDWAEAHATGHWYGYGSTGLAYYDCSGLWYRAAEEVGISIPRTTYGMLAGSAHLYRIPLSSARRGDLLFYGSGHVEIDTAWYHTTFGAQHTGTRVGWHPWSVWWAPTMAMRLR
jgi:cell wall-associated NlpC family hydrolase